MFGPYIAHNSGWMSDASRFSAKKNHITPCTWHLVGLPIAALDLFGYNEQIPGSRMLPPKKLAA